MLAWHRKSKAGFIRAAPNRVRLFRAPRAATATNLNGLSDWTHIGFALIKPLYTFGKVEHYGDAAQGNIDIKRGELKQTRTDTVYDTKRAYFGYLAARDIRVYLEDLQRRCKRNSPALKKN